MGLRLSHCDLGWSYSGFMVFREAIANACGLTGNLVDHYINDTYTQLANHPIYPLINHSDCDGQLSVAEMNQLVPAIKNILTKLDPRHQDAALEFIDGMKNAIACDEPMIFE